MGTKGIRLKMLLLPLMVVIVLTEATGSQVALDTEVNLPAIVFRKEHGIPAKFQESAVQMNFCAAFPVSDETFLTSAHCLATAPRTKSIDLVGLGKVVIEKIEVHPMFDLAAFQLKNVIPLSGHVSLNSNIPVGSCNVLVLNNAFRWVVLRGATPTRCQDNVSKEKICFKSEKTPAGLDFVVFCELGRTLHAVFHSQRGSEISFTVCKTTHCSEFIKQSVTTRVKRQTDDAPADTAPADTAPADTAPADAAPAPADAAPAPADTPPVDAAPAPADTPPADAAPAPADPAPSPADKPQAPANAAVPPTDVASPATSDGSPASSAPTTPTDTGDVPLPPPKQLFPNMPEKFPYPMLDVVQNPPVPTRPRKRPGFQNPYPVQAAKENVHLESLPAINSVPSGQPTPQIQEKPQTTPVVANEGDVSVQLPIRTESVDTSDLTEYEVLGTHDAPILPANNDIKEKEAPVMTQQVTTSDDHNIASDDHYTASDGQHTTSDSQYTAPAVVQQRVQRPSSGGFAMAPADWRYSVTPRPHRKCKTTTSRPSCRAQQPSTAEADAYNYREQTAAVSPAMDAAVHSSPGNYQPTQAMAAAASVTIGPSRPVGPDPWMVAAHEAVPTGFVKPKEDEKLPEGAPVESAAESNRLAAISLLLANALYFLL